MLRRTFPQLCIFIFNIFLNSSFPWVSYFFKFLYNFITTSVVQFLVNHLSWHGINTIRSSFLLYCLLIVFGLGWICFRTDIQVYIYLGRETWNRRIRKLILFSLYARNLGEWISIMINFTVSISLLCYSVNGFERTNLSWIKTTRIENEFFNLFYNYICCI